MKDPIVKKKIKREKLKVPKPNTPVKKDCPIPVGTPDSPGGVKAGTVKRNIKKRNVDGG